MCDSLQHLKQDIKQTPQEALKELALIFRILQKSQGVSAIPLWVDRHIPGVVFHHRKLERLHKLPSPCANLHPWAPGLQFSVETGALMSAISCVAHPALYELAREALVRVEDHIDDVAVLKAWSLVFNALSIISNRETLVHQDRLSKAEWYGMLESVGDYNEAILELTGAGFCFKFDSGTIAGFSRKLLSWGFVLQW
ncbi:hypothetical protein SERLA73DRAFT_149079 [Serpula lacrymans var. lacrymans S7.3]|uniref:Uncharacterized protein n=1 Tax=Serpula lacrymans var. lacrymans (strain S7.3) TaxID=936435 RepID=F8PEY9_SERL3|nr:hypothetical protein SERLA73DRAFT_149079 [Serpula lacrymans var. lacrymans S7.3]